MMKRFMTRTAVAVLAAMLVSCGGGGGDEGPGAGGTAGAPSGGTPPVSDPGSGTPTPPPPPPPPTGGDPTPPPPPPPAGGDPTPPPPTGGTLPSAGARVEESDPAVTLSAGWSLSNPSFGWSGGSARQSTLAGAKATFTFNGTSVRWIGRRSTDMGIARVSVDDGPPIEVNLYAKPLEIRTPIITLYGLAPGTHKLTVEVTGSADPRAGSNLVVVDAFEVEPPIVSHIQETDTDVAFTTAGWVQSPDNMRWSGGGVASLPEPPIGGAKEAQAAGETVTLNFRGTAVSWIGYRGPDAGIATVRIDGGAPTEVDLYSPSSKVQVVVFTASGLANTTHTLTIQATGRKNDASSAARVVADAFDVMKPGRRWEESNAKDPNPKIIFAGPWNDDNVNRTWSEGMAATTSTAGASVIFTFTGTSVSWIGCRKATIGRARVFLDGEDKGVVKMFKDVPIEDYQHAVYRVDGLTNGVHTLRIEAVGDGIVVVDAFDVDD